MNESTEVWLRGTLPEYPLELQAVAHAILQAQEEIHKLMKGFPTILLWEKIEGMASPAFHLQHIAGVLDRMATYSQANPLNSDQFLYLKTEGVKNDDLDTNNLIMLLDEQIAKFLQILSQTDPTTLIEYRGVGRNQLPSTVGGLLFHAAEHTQRHFGQLFVTVNILKAKSKKSNFI